LTVVATKATTTSMVDLQSGSCKPWWQTIAGSSSRNDDGC